MESIFSVFDAHSKLQSGILEGNFANLGDFDECINVDSEESGDNGERIRGKYCFGDFGKVVIVILEDIHLRLKIYHHLHNASHCNVGLC